MLEIQRGAIESTRKIPQLVENLGQPTEKSITIGNKTLMIPASIEKQICELGLIIANCEYGSEILGWGLTKPHDTVVKLVEFISPDSNKVFNLKTDRFMSDEEEMLMELLAVSDTLDFIARQGEALIISNKNENQGMRFSGNVSWIMMKSTIEDLVGFSLPSSVLGLEPSIALRTDWEQIIACSTLMITPNFVKKVMDRAKETEANPDFETHYHPDLKLDKRLLENKDLITRYNYYTKLLQPSPADLRSTRSRGIDFFEIRAFGTPDDLYSKSKTTSRYYRVSEIPQG